MRRIVLLVALLSLVTAADAQQWRSVSPPGADGFFLTGVDMVGSKGFVIGWAGGRKAAILTSADSGATWSGANADGHILYDLKFSDPSNGIVVGYEYDCRCGVILKTTNGGGSWEKSTDASVGSYSSLTFINAATGFMLGGDSKLMKTTDGGATWSAAGDLPGSFARVLFTSATQGYGLALGEGGRPTKVYRTTNGGSEWTLLHDANGQRVYSGIYFLSSTEGFITGMENGMAIYRTTDAGATWTRVLSGPNIEEQLVNDLKLIDGTNGFAAANDGKILRTRDGGKTWTQEASATGSSLNAIDFVSPKVWVAAGNFGALVRRFDQSAGQKPVAMIDADGLDFGSVKVGREQEASFTIRAGNNAELVIDSIYVAGPASVISQFTITAPAPGELPVSLEGDAPLQVTLAFKPTGTGTVQAELVVTTNDPNLPQKRILLEGNAIAGAPLAMERRGRIDMMIAPNPARSTFGSIDVILPTPGRLTVDLYDLLGNKVASLHDAPSEGGRHHITFDPMSLPPGSYRCVADLAGERVSQTVLIVR